MIQVESISITNFRGIRHLELDMKRESFGICGNNGTGKSGVVDAIEFALTGNITRLSGRGTSGLSVKSHGPHVDHRDDPAGAKVVLGLYFPDLRKSATVERTIKNPKDVVITPDEPSVRRLIDQAASHPELALSRREILKYVLTEPGERSKEVQALLKLDAIEKTRAAFQGVANAAKAEQKRYEADVAAARTSLLSALKVEEVKSDAILGAVNERRSVIGLLPLATLGKDTSLKDGVLQAQRKTAINKVTALEEAARLNSLLLLDDPATDASRKETAELLSQLEEKPALLASFKKRSFFAAGLSLVDDELCPLCDHGWNQAELRTLIQRKLSEAREAEELREKLKLAAAPLERVLETLTAAGSACLALSGQLQPSIDTTVAAGWIAQLKALRLSLSGAEGIALTRATLQGDWRARSAGLLSWVENLTSSLIALPDTSAEEIARDYLIVAQERLETYQKARRLEALWKERSSIAVKATETYAESSRRVLTEVYGQVEADFSRFYQSVNREDEAAFHAKFTPAKGKLGFDVDFYGRGMFPPGAYHSEGHQDGMGLCLYLALMRRLLGSEFRLAVLDDVLMSVDAGHRKEVCKLLRAEFPDTQFIITTHDPVWLNHMLAERIVTSKSVIHFRKWTLEDGPQIWEHEDVWIEIARDLEVGNVPGASHTLRRYLEFVTNELSAKVRAKVEYNASASYDFGELLPAVVSRWSDLLKKAKDAAQSWGRNDALSVLVERHEAFKRTLDRSQVEKWAINATVHYNSWANLQPADFDSVVVAFKELIASFACSSCGGFFYVMPQKGNVEEVRCDCGAVTFNLKKKG